MTLFVARFNVQTRPQEIGLFGVLLFFAHAMTFLIFVGQSSTWVSENSACRMDSAYR